MGAPSQPTDTSIVTQAYKDYGITSPTSAQISRAITDGIEWVKRDLENLGHTWKFMVKNNYIITTQGTSSYAVPTDYVKFITARVGEGTKTGTARGGSTAVCTLAAAEAATSNDILGKFIAFTGGSGVSQGAQIAAYNATTKLVTFDQALSTAVDNTSTYLIIDTFADCDDQTVADLRDLTIPSIQGKPTILVHVPDSLEGRVMFNYAPDKTYAVEFRYYADLLKEDTLSTRYATTFMRLAAGLLTQGVFVWLLQDDTRRDKELGIYFGMKRQFANRWLYGYDLSGLQMTTGEE